MTPSDPQSVSDSLKSLFGEDSETFIDGDEANYNHEEVLKAQSGLELVKRAVEHERLTETTNSTVDQFTADDLQLFDTIGDNAVHQNQIGRFEIIRELGRGGFGVVLLARDPRLDRQVALKIPSRTTLCNEEALARFEREAQSAAILGHPNIVPIYESGAIGPIKYIAFEYCQGETLGSWFNRRGRKIEPKFAAEIVATLADALQHAHSKKVVHRDLKPANILIGDESTELMSSLKITDFGLAKFATHPDTLTRPGATIGTPAYMSPEQARGDNRNVGPAADIYALGAILYELVCGQVPFTGENNIKTLREIETTAPPLPQKIRPGIDPDIQAICLKCLEKRAEDRYSNAKELNEDLQRYTQGRSIVARRPNRFARTARWISRNRIVSTLAATILLSLLAGLIATLVQYKKAQSNLIATRENYQQARAAVDDLMEAAKDPSLAQLPRVREKLLERAMNYYNWFLTQQLEDPTLQMDRIVAYESVASAARERGAYDQSLEFHRDAQRLVGKFIDEESSWEDRLLGLNNRINIGLLLDLKKDFKQSQAAYQDAIAEGEQMLVQQSDEPELRATMGRAYKNLGFVYREQLDYESAYVYYQKSLTTRLKLAEQFPDDEQYKRRLSLTYMTLADWYIEKKMPDQALEAGNLGLRVAEQLARNHPDELKMVLLHSRALNRLADVYRNFNLQKDWERQAISRYEESLAISRELVNQYPLQLAPVKNWFNGLCNIGDIHRKSGNHDKALATYATGQTILQDWIDNNQGSSGLRMTMSQLLLRQGLSLDVKGNREQAIEKLNDAVAEMTDVLNESPDYVEAQNQLRTIRNELQKLLSAKDL